jgi:hypothetical protein
MYGVPKTRKIRHTPESSKLFLDAANGAIIKQYVV